jgi:hypothetical protein
MLKETVTNFSSANDTTEIASAVPVENPKKYFMGKYPSNTYKYFKNKMLVLA